MTRPLMVSAIGGYSTSALEATNEEPEVSGLRLYTMPLYGASITPAGSGVFVMLATWGQTGGVCVDANNNIYVQGADASFSLRRVNWTDGIITTVSTTVSGAADQIAYDPVTNRIWCRGGPSGTDPDGTHLRMKVYDLGSGVTSTVDITVPAVGGVSAPGYGGCCFAPDGTMYIAARGQWNVYRVPTGTTVGTLYAGSGVFSPVFSVRGDGGPATAATFRTLFGLNLDSTGKLYIGDSSSLCVRVVDPTTHIITTAYDNFLDGGGYIATPAVLPGDTLLVNAFGGGLLYTINAGLKTLYAGIPGGSNANKTPALISHLDDCAQMCTDPYGHVWLACWPNGAGNIFKLLLIADQTHLPSWIAP